LDLSGIVLTAGPRGLEMTGVQVISDCRVFDEVLWLRSSSRLVDRLGLLSWNHRTAPYLNPLDLSQESGSNLPHLRRLS